jgi:hypothetical protein
MADVNITWVLGAGNLDNITSIVVHRKENGTCEQLQAAALAGDPAPIFTDTNKTAISYTDTGVGVGTWEYGVFVKNSAGVSVCHGTSSETVVIP